MTRRGTTLLEVIVAGMLLGTLLVLCLQLVSAANDQRWAADRRQCASVELGNVMERVAARPWAELTAAALAQEKISPSAAGQLPGAALKVEISPEAKGSDVKRITATLRWQDRSGQFLAPVTLATWRYKIVD
jgi:hypothetical protein